MSTHWARVLWSQSTLTLINSRSHVRLNLYTNPEDGKYYASRNTQPKEPDAWIDLPIDYKTGVDLTVARKTWGLESLAVRMLPNTNIVYCFIFNISLI